ncbi:MAG TPA: hypothetical protein PLW35_08395, partial [Verrucomicrobiota bacterium]|nr:hypothetical protein [Verrucomicrobiota bacterium]
MDKETYWLAEPYSTNKHENAGYYWSPNARKVFAVQSGPIFVTWKKAEPYTAATKPSDYENPGGPPSFETNGASIYLLYTMRYVVSSSPIKQPRKMFWTERGFRRFGKPVAVPLARVGDIQIVYNNAFPRTVDNEYSDPTDTSPTEGSTNQTLRELRTLWYDKQQGNLFAYNREGRVFVEILGDVRSDNSRVHLGFEIVDVFKHPTPLDVTIELGERITPPPPGDITSLFPDPILQGPVNFTFQRQVAGTDRPEYYATRETVNLNDYLVHWMEEGVAGLKWPSLLGRYKLAWPTDVAKYSHYIRPPAATEAEAKETAIPLSALNTPTIEYQDPLDRPRAKLTETFEFYTWLDREHPAHRTLLRFTSGDEVAFERVFSWLDEGLHHPDLNLPVFCTDFSAPRAGAAVYGNAKIEGGFLRLTEALQNQYGQYVIDDFYGGQPVSNFRARFLISIRDGTARIADGFSFNFGTMPSPISDLDEEGVTSGLSVSFDSYDNNADDVAPTISIKLNGNIVAAVSLSETNIYPEPSYVLPIPMDPETDQPMTMRTGDNFAPVEIELRGDGTMDVSYKNVKVLANVATGYTPRTGQFGLGARTSGNYNAHWVDDLAIVVNRHEDAATFCLARSVATNLNSWVADATFNWPETVGRPRVVTAMADVGERINAPEGELGATGSYLAGHINEKVGTLYNPQAYRDPLSVGFAEANAGAIIPVNAIPGQNKLEVWWFRTNSVSAGPNAGNKAKGFETIYWPSVIGTYTLQWPAAPREIVLASLIGSGTLGAMEALGTIYRQNDQGKPGYNPNEEHAIMAGGVAFALRDDLNITSGANYSSEPFVLVSYTAEDGRPAMSAFKVLREKPEAGYVFDYITTAGQLLQAPMPLPLMAKPVEGSGESAKNYNTEPSHSGGDLPVGWHDDDANGPYGHYKGFTWRDRHEDFWVYRGLHAGLPELKAGRYDTATGTFGPLPAATAVVGQGFKYTVHCSRQDQYLMLSSRNLPNWLTIRGLAIEGTPTTGDVTNPDIKQLMRFMARDELVVEDLYDHARVTNELTLSVVASGTVQTQAPLSLFSTNKYTHTIVVFTNRPPFLAASPEPSNSFTMRYYYKTEPGFDWPGLASPPPVGTIVPYLRPKDPDTGLFIGDPASKNTESLEIVYRPVWPVRDPKDASKPLPTLPFGATLAGPKAGLPGVRDMRTAHILYQQSIAQDMATKKTSVVLHDPTRAKFSDLKAQGLSALPGGIHTDYYMGSYYFPNLPPHLVKRVYYDPNRGAKGSLVLKGEYVAETLGESYLLLNVLRGSDLAAVKALCPAADPDKSKWEALVDALATDVETFRESATKPGTYEPNPSLTVSVKVGELAEVTDANTAVDSYALSATGPGSGYVTLVESGGTA